MMTPKEIALCAAGALSDKKGEDLKLLEVKDITVVADYFLICTATSNTHVKALCDEVEHRLDLAGEPMRRREGQRSDTWVLLDYGCVIVHVFTEDTRKFYDLERLWNDATPIALDIIEQ